MPYKHFLYNFVQEKEESYIRLEPSSLCKLVYLKKKILKNITKIKASMLIKYGERERLYSDFTLYCRCDLTSKWLIFSITPCTSFNGFAIFEAPILIFATRRMCVANTTPMDIRTYLNWFKVLTRFI